MIKVSVCYSRKERDEFASCSIGEIELDASILDDATAFRDRVKTAYEKCVDAVDIQLGGSSAVVPASPPVASQSPAAPAASPSPPASRNASGSGSGQSKEGPPTSARELGGWAKRHGVTKWFSEFGRAQKPPLPGMLIEWSDDWAVFAYQQWLTSQAAVPQSNGSGKH
jgi:hypothetical protein